MDALHVNRSLDVVEKEAIRQLGTLSIDDALQTGSNVSIQSRGRFGVQTDIGIRGSLFSQNLILIDGIPLNDQQTAHHNFDIPIPHTLIERIEVLKGPGSSQYGANAFGGVINIITQEPKESSGSIRLSGGEHGLFEGAGSITVTPAFLRSSNSFELRRSDGYRYDTDFSLFNLSTNTRVDLPWGVYSFLGGYSKKVFGAYDFYSPGRNKPSKEWTETTFFTLSTTLDYSSLKIIPRIYYRKHYDKFLFDIRIPDRYLNEHRTHNIGGEIIGQIQASERFTCISGLEANLNTITSSSLGNHHQSLLAVFISSQFTTENRITLDLGMRADFHSDYGTQFNPTAGAGYIFSSRGKIFATLGRSFRTPSYTELYYSDPSTVGNPNLRPEVGWSAESGIDYMLGNNWHCSASFFYRDQTNLIDYVRFLPSDTQSVAVNFISAKTRGFDADIHWQMLSFTETPDEDDLSIQQITFSYEYLDSHIERGSVYSSRYAFTHPRHRIFMSVSAIIPFAITVSLDAAHFIKLNQDNYTLINARVIKHFGSISMFVRGTNLLNKSYEEIIGVPLPGRWLWGGIELKIF
jgi:vitamin B12 transporter